MAISQSFWRIPAARSALEKAGRAVFQTVEQGRKNTTIFVDEDEALVVRWAIAEYIAKHAEGKMTNGDKIRAMTDVDIAWWFCKNRSCGRCQYKSSRGCTFLEWLKQEAEE